MSFSLIVPAAGIQKGSKELMPKIFMPGQDGILRCIKSILGLSTQSFDRIIFTILESHAKKFDIDTLLKLQFKRLGLTNAELLILDSPTKTQADTIAVTIKECGIEGSVFFKDADCYFKADVYPENGVAVCALESLPLVDPRNKSYVTVDDMQHITNIIEKKIIGNLFNAGGYCFSDVQDFIKAYEEFSPLGNIYLSHIIYGMLLYGHTFIPVYVSAYNDYNI